MTTRRRSGARPRAERVRLSHGPRLLLIPMPAARSVAVAVHVRVGSRYERSAQNGISHFLEHMLHRGTASHPSAHEQALAFERLGATLSASTYVDHGVLGVVVPPDGLLPVLDLLGEVCREPVFDAIEVERGIVREEILESLDARGRPIGADDLLREQVFPRHPLGAPITGSLSTLEKFDRDALARHHRSFYTRRLVVTVAGNFVRREAVAAVRRAFVLPPGSPPRAVTPRPLRGPTRLHVRDSGSQTALRLGFRAPGQRHRDEPAAELLLRVIDDGTSTRLYHRICDERGLCYDVSALLETYEDSGIIDIAADTAHDKAVEVASEILRMLRELGTEGPREDELDKARMRLRWQLEAMHDSPAELASFYGFGELAGVHRTPEERLRSLSAVRARDVKAVAARIFRPSGLGLVTVGELSRSRQRAIERAVGALA